MDNDVGIRSKMGWQRIEEQSEEASKSSFRVNSETKKQRHQLYARGGDRPISEVVKCDPPPL